MNVMDAIRTRRSVREYSPEPIPGDLLDRMKEALRLAPSACDNQPWTFILVQDATLRRGLAETSRSQTFIAEAPVIVVGVGHPGTAYKKMGGSGNSVEIDIAIALDHLSLAAAADGLGTCWIGAFNEESVKSLLGIPGEDHVVAMMPLGFPADPAIFRTPRTSQRKSAKEIFRVDKY